MSRGSTKQNRGVLLDCEHTVWFKVMHAPSPGETVWCRQCDDYATVPTHESERGTYYPDGEWWCYRVGTGARGIHRGVCDRCGHEHKALFHVLRTHMERHHLRQCEPALEITTMKLPPNSPPPF